MKRSLTLIGVVLLLSVAACHREMETPSPYYDDQTNTVRTEFVMNISTGTGRDTKTTATYVQDGIDFLGMDAVHILAYALPDSLKTTEHGSFYYAPFYASGKPIPAVRDFNLGTLFPAKAVDADNSSRTMELALPLGTNAMLLYGKALKTRSDDLQGKIEPAGDPSNLTTLTFSLQSRLTSQADFDAGAYLFSRMLTYFTLAGLVDNSSFWRVGGQVVSTGTSDDSYGFWWPTPTTQVMEDLPENPLDGRTAEVSGQEYVYYAGQVSWKQMGRMYDYDHDEDDATNPNKLVKTNNGTFLSLAPLVEVLGSAYSQLTTIPSDGGLKELRAGSAGALLRTMQDLYDVIERAADTDATGWEEEIAHLLALNIKARMDRYFTRTSDGFDFIHNSAGAVDVASILLVLPTCVDPTEWASYRSIVQSKLNASYFVSNDNEGFPINVGLPHGGAILATTIDPDIRTVDTFAYSTDIPAYGFGNHTFPITNYRYPAELMYYGNSALRINKESIKADNYPSNVELWPQESQWPTGWVKYGTVKSDTRSVAMVNNINYGTALLSSTVVYGATKLSDNNHALHPTEQDQVLDVSAFTSGQGFRVTGIVVGGQADVMGWDYTRQPLNPQNKDIRFDGKKFTGMIFSETDSDGNITAENLFDKMIYDKVTTPYWVGVTPTPIYTMVWDNYDATKDIDKQSDVYVGVELVNDTDMDLWGEMNLIRKGGTFYLLGKLDLATAVTNARKENAAAFGDLDRSDHCYPPYDPATGETINAPRVFMQDYKTSATLKLTADCLKHAYVTVPDLRSSQISLGVSIDLDWEPGLAFDVNMGTLN